MNVSGYTPPVPAAGVPASVAVPLPLSTNVTPAGSVPPTVIVGGRLPAVVIVNVPGVPARKLVEAGLVNRSERSALAPTNAPPPPAKAMKLASTLLSVAAEDFDVRPAAPTRAR